MDDSTDWKVVLIDDEEDIREVMTLTLRDAGYAVEAAADGVNGIRLCDESSPQIVITDIRMPGLDGIQVLEIIKQKYPDIEVIVATAYGEMDLAIRALQLDASDFITKPISDEALYQALRRAKDRFTSRKQLQDYTSLLEKEKAATSQELVKAIEFQRNLIESSMDGILGCDDEATVVTFNRSMEQMVGYTKAEAIHRMKFEDFFSAKETAHFKERLADETHGGKNRLYLFETKLQSKPGHDIPVQVSATKLHGQDRPGGLVCFFRDLREMRKLEREVADQARILHQDKMMSLGRLAASVVHEINNPLSGILNYLRLMIRILEQGALAEARQEKFRRYLTLIESETSRCSRIVSNLLSFSRKSPPAFGEVHVDELLQRCILLSQHKMDLSNIRLKSDVQANIPPVQGDINQLQQCLINLIFNAIDAMPDGGHLYLEGAYNVEKGSVIVAVKDSGPGITPEVLPYIFDPFFTTKQEGYGVGLGLSTVYGIMKSHRGRVTVENLPEGGTAFLLELPPAYPPKRDE